LDGKETEAEKPAKKRKRETKIKATKDAEEEKDEEV
jgi:hypothetical protein